MAHAKRRKYAEAEACLSAAIRAEPSMLHAYFARGDARAERGDWAAAAADMTEAIRQCARYEADVSAADAYRQRGRCRVHLKDFRGAVADYTEALRLRPGDADAYEGRALARRGAGDEDGARADLWEAGRLRRTRD